MMNNDLISRKALLEQECFMDDDNGFRCSVVLSADVRRAPAVDAETVCEQMGLVKEALEMAKADLVAVRHGRWESVKNPQWPAYSHDKCNLCGWWNTKNALCYDGNKKPGHSLNYCPNCGAKMDGDSHD